MQRLLLFDIDGTLLASNGVGSIAMSRAMDRLMGDSSVMGQIGMAGKCDWAIWREALALVGYSPDEADAQMEELFRSYVAELADVLGSSQLPAPHVLPGVRALLEALAPREGILLGLLTGNVEAAAWLKLGRAGLDHFFSFGAFGNESADRAALPVIAVERAGRFAGGKGFTGKEIVVIGDTVHDIRCGEALGVCSVGVATGRTDGATLARAGADYVFESLSPRPELLAALTGRDA